MNTQNKDQKNSEYGHFSRSLEVKQIHSHHIGFSLWFVQCAWNFDWSLMPFSKLVLDISNSVSMGSMLLYFIVKKK